MRSNRFLALVISSFFSELIFGGKTFALQIGMIFLGQQFQFWDQYYKTDFAATHYTLVHSYILMHFLKGWVNLKQNIFASAL